MSRALVLGGGGPVGIGWEAGLALGLAAHGVRWADADLIVGTSAGSVVGAQLALGMDLAQAVDQVSRPLPLAGDGSAAIAGMESLMAAMADAASGALDPLDARIALGRIALAAETVAEDDFVAVFSQVAGMAWPEGYRCTAIDVETGELRVWDRAAGVPLERAVASSCAVPVVFPPVTVDGRRYMDGGMRTALNTDIAAGHDTVVAVSCFPLGLPEGMSDPVVEAVNAAVEAEFVRVREAGGTLEVVLPGDEFLDLSGWGLHLMDPTRVEAAHQAGLRQAAAEADRLRAAWGA